MGIRWNRSGSLVLKALILAGVLMQMAPVSLSSASLPFADDIGQAGLLTDTSGTGVGSNVGATVQPEEPRHSSRVGGHSVWVSWMAPTNGLANFSTMGSSFESVLGVYAYESALRGGSNDPPDPANPFDGLEALTQNDDELDNSAVTTAVQFPALAGVRYHIVVDGVAGATGDIVLTWSFAPSGAALPVVTGMPADRALREGDGLVLSFGVETAGTPVYRWYLNGQPLNDAVQSSLALPSLGHDEVGKYQLQVESGNFTFLTAPIEIQINSEGDTNSLARDRLVDAIDSGFVGEQDGGGGPDVATWRSALPKIALQGLPIGVTRGYDGSQVFSTIGAHRDPGEPSHCGVQGGASYWWSYKPPADGAAEFDTDGSTFDTVLAVYTFNLPYQGYQSLIPVACDNNSGSNGLTSRLQCQVQSSRTYLVVVDGVNGAQGLVHLNYHLSTGSGSIPNLAITTQPASQSVDLGATAVFTVAASGLPPLQYQWRFNGQNLADGTNATLTLAHAALAQAGSYDVVVSDSLTNLASAPASLTVHLPLIAPSIVNQPTNQTVITGQIVTLNVVAAGTPPLLYQWRWEGVPVPGATNDSLTFSPVALSQAGHYSVTVSNAVGQADSSAAWLRVLETPALQVGLEGGVMKFSILSVPGLHYTLHYSPAVQGSWSWLYSFDGTGEPVTFSSSPVGDAMGFIQIRVQ